MRYIALLLILLGGTGALAAPSPPAFPAWEHLLFARDSGQTELSALARLGMSGAVERGDRFTALADLDLLLRSHDSEQLQDYRSYEQRLAWRRLSRGHWLHCGLSRKRGELRQRDIYSDDDRLAADARGDVLRLAAGFRRGDWGAQFSLGSARGRLEFSAEFLRRLGPSLLQLGLAKRELGWDLEQSFAGKRFRFDFPLQRERLSIAFVSGSRDLPSLDLYQEDVGCNRDRLEGDFNRLMLLRRGGSLAWAPGGSWPGIEFDIERGQLTLRMFADGVSYLYLPRLDYHSHALSLTSELPGRLRLLLGHREQKLGAEDGYAEPGPFIAWGVFTNDHYVIDSLRYRLLVWSTGLAREFRLASAHTLDLSLRHLWLHGGGLLDWKKRVWTMWPIFFRYDHASVDLPLPARRVLRVDLSARSRVGSACRVELRLRQLLPLDDLLSNGDDGTPSTPSGPGKDEGFAFGGLRVSLRVDFDLK